MPVNQLKKYLDEQHVKYFSIIHSDAYTAQEVAAAAHIAGRKMAKVVVVELDGETAMAVLPADRKVVLQDLREVTGSEQVRFVSESKFKDRFPDCEIGAMPPFGNLYGMQVYVADPLAMSDTIAFNAGTHSEVIQMDFIDFERLVQPRVVSFTT
jgi:Ala-tRNA(Pro) deacylase